MTIDTLALAAEQEFQKIQKEFRGLHSEMGEIKATIATLATKEESKSMKDEILLAIREMDTRLSASMARTSEDISGLQKANREFDVRLRIVEKHG